MATVEWIGSDIYAQADFGLFSVQAFQDPSDDRFYKYRIGARQSSGKYTTLNGAKLAGLKAIEKACKESVESIESMIGECERVFKDAQRKILNKNRKKNKKKLTMLDL
jgi:hypothetical protein